MITGWAGLSKRVLVFVLGTLVVVNLLFWVVVRTGGPLIGAGFYLVLLILTCRGGSPGNRNLILGGIAGFTFHLLEIILVGWSPFPFLMILNLFLPILLILVALLAGKEV
jgi:hypothetical protein